MGSADIHWLTDRGARVAWLSLAMSIVLLSLKFVAYHLTGSAAVLSDALESIVNVIASGFALFSVTLSARPPDESHPYGHGRIEFFSAGFEGALIIAAALAICAAAIPRVFAPEPITRLSLGMLLVCAAGAANALLGFYLQYVGHRTHSLALVADGKHLLSDAYTSAGVLLGILGVMLTGWHVLDALTALAVAFHILVMGWHLVRESIARLMDEAEPALLQRIVQTMQTARQDAWIDIHNLRAWRSGPRYHVDFHLTLPRYWALEHSHAVAQQIEHLIEETQPTHGDVIIHLDPCMPSDCPCCALSPCPVRAAAQQEHRPWTVAAAIGGPMSRVSEMATP
ncbi:MAG: cation transporter [Candidatus Tectomicrobia bacterium]|uniref:Cation transporter n=1 Tax=Tectimicrobiota bacterium TaxID=2528274 RepID=A0A938B2C5_UNCTE|nr:cation transporter [Candidatus Tectomicrobia bacterium]